VLFVPNTHLSMEAKVVAYTSAGGAFVSSKEKLQGLNEPADRIYICRNSLTDTAVDQVSTLSTNWHTLSVASRSSSATW
jgi:hypothetical protein